MLRAASRERFACSLEHRCLPDKPRCLGVEAPLSLRFRLHTNRTNTGDRRKRTPALLDPFSFVKISDSLLGNDMADIISVDHDRRDGHTGLPSDFDCIECLDECRHTALGEGLQSLHHNFPASSGGAWICLEVEPRRCGMPAAVRVVSHIRRATETGKTARGYGR